MIAQSAIHIFNEMGVNMEIKVSNTSIQTVSADAILVSLFEGNATPSGAAGEMNKALNGSISELLRAGDHRGNLNEVAVLYTRGTIPTSRVIVIGLGKAKELSLERI